MFYRNTEAKDLGLLTILRHHHMYGWTLHAPFKPYVVIVGLHDVSGLGTVKIDHAMVTTLVARWLQETHTFHFSINESTVTLQEGDASLNIQIDD